MAEINEQEIRELYDMVQEAFVGQKLLKCSWDAEPGSLPINLIFKRGNIFIYEPWRCSRAGKIAGSASDEDSWHALLGEVHNLTIERIEIAMPWHDLKVYLEDGTLIENFQDSDRYECWQASIYDTEGNEKLIVAGNRESMDLFVLDR